VPDAATAESRRELVRQAFLLECLTLACMVIEAGVAMGRSRWQGRQWGMRTRSRGQDRAAVVGFESGRSAAYE